MASSCSAHDRTREWRACCHAILMSRDPSKERSDSFWTESDCDDDDDDAYDCLCAPGYLAINMVENSLRDTNGQQHIHDDAWMQAALAISASIDEASLMIQSQTISYNSSIDTFKICFQDESSRSKSNFSTSNTNRSILETTVASFTAGMAKQIDSLRQTVVIEGDHPFIKQYHDSEDSDRVPLHWSTGPIGHRAGIASCLMQRLKYEIMETMTNLQLQREKFSGQDASVIASNPLRGLSSILEPSTPLSPPPAPWEIGDHDSEKEQREREQERNEFWNIYSDEKQRTFDLSKAREEIGSKMSGPPSLMQYLDVANRKSPPRELIKDVVPKPSTQSFSVTKSNNNAKGSDAYLKSSFEEERAEETIGQLQRESAALVAAYQHSDLEGVQKVERSMLEITQLLSRFTDLITEQQEDIFLIHDQALKSKENVDKGQDELVGAATRGEKSKHPMASFIAIMALLLLIFNWILP